MRYDRDNVMPGTLVIDATSKKWLQGAMTVDTDAGEVECAYIPYRVAPDGESVETFKLKFDCIQTSIHAPTGLPNEFKCYGPRA